MTNEEAITILIREIDEDPFMRTEYREQIHEALNMAIKALEQQPKTGHWIYTDYYTWCCSECGGNPHRGTGFVPNKDGMKMRWKYCNLCGARMESEEQK